MCGIVGLLSSSSVIDRLLQGLGRLEYRGYDSAGIVTIANRKMERRRAAGKLSNLLNLLAQQPLDSTVGLNVGPNIGIGHTRWATHGPATDNNAHPHGNGKVSLVHNGIIENFTNLKQSLHSKGYTFDSETDTEVVVHLISDFMDRGLSPLEATQATVAELKGSFALAILFRDYPNLMIAAKRGSPLVIGYNNNQEGFLASDGLALSGWVDHLCYLEDGDIAALEINQQNLLIKIYEGEGNLVNRKWLGGVFSMVAVTKDNYPHFMLKEIFEQPAVLNNLIKSYNLGSDGILQDLNNQLGNQFEQVFIVACGTSYYAGMVAKYWFESIFKIPTQVEIASEFRYRNPCLNLKTLYVFLSQSGETIDTLAALELVKKYQYKNLANNTQNIKTPLIKTLAIVNAAESSLARLVDKTIYTKAGPEIGVASTKAFTAQLLSLARLGMELGATNNNINIDDFANILTDIPTLVEQVLKATDIYKEVAINLSNLNNTGADNAFYLGRGVQYPIALEGALKLKELSYIHAEGYAAGELKHGPIALIDDNMPVIVLAPADEWFEKTLSNTQEVLARGAKVIMLTEEKVKDTILAQIYDPSKIQIICLPSCNTLQSPFVYAIAVQLLAYYSALHRGNDIDQPRNLAKSVTVE